MKTALLNTQNNSNIKMAVIAFQQPQARQFERGQYHTYKLCTTPAGPASPIYKLSVQFSDNGTLEEWIKFQHGLQAVLKGQNVTQGPPSYAVVKTLLKGNALTVFKQAEIDHGTLSVAHFKLCLDGMSEHMFPKKAGQTQRHYMRRNLQLVGEMTIKEWVAW
eukprot:5089963-Ditylum_brightwellii.AAC.1